MKEFLHETYTIILPVLLGYIVWLLKSQKTVQMQIADHQKQEQNANNKGTMLLLRVQIIEYFDKWSERGYRTKHGTENVMEMYEAYHSLGGNGMIDDLMKQLGDLPIRDE